MTYVFPDLEALVRPASVALIGASDRRDSAARGVRFAILLSAGFGETGEDGKHAEEEMRALVAASGLRIYGPNCPGLSNINDRLGFTFSPAFKLDLRTGPLGVATQGGGLGRTVLQAMERGVGVGLWCSAGNEVDLEVSDFIHHMAGDPGIRVIATLIEGIRDGAKFAAAAAHAAAHGKPLVALKVGKSDYGIKATLSHTAAIAGSADINSAAFRQLGIVEVDDIDELIDTAWLLARARPRASERIAVYCSSGGTAALAADMIGTAGLTLAEFAPATTARLTELLPSFAAIGNPVDTTAEVLADMTVIDRSLAAVCADPGVGLVLHPFPMEYGAATTRAAQSVVAAQSASPIPLLPVWISDRTGDGYRLLVEAGLAPVRSLGKAVKATRRWAAYGDWLAACDAAWRPLLAPEGSGVATPLSEAAAKDWLRAAGIAVPAAEVAATRAEAVALAAGLGYPVVAKVVSATIVHKSEVGGVIVGLKDAAAVEAAWDAINVSVAAARPDAAIDGILIEPMAPAGGVETLVGVHRDPVFGHVLTFGLGGIYVELFRDAARRVLPLTARDARDIIRETRCFALLDGARGRPRADIAALEALLLAVSDFVRAYAERIEEIDLNPVWVGAAGQGVRPLDAVIVARGAT